MAEDREEGSPRHWLLVVALLAIYIYAFIDRVILALLVDPIQRDLGVTDVQMGLLLGVAFALFFGVCGIPSGALVDRFNRRAMIGLASVFWASMTIVCGAAHSFGGLFLARAGVGMAEAIVLPAAFSLIQNAVPTRSRGLAFSIFAMAPLIGSTLALLLGSRVLAFAIGGGFADWPILDGLAAWRTTLIVTGAAGLPLGLLLLLAPEPARPNEGAAPAVAMSILAGFADALRHIRAHARIYLPLLAFASAGAMSNFTLTAWAPALLGRAWSLTPQAAGAQLGAILLPCGVGGLAVSGLVLSRIASRGGDIRVYGLIAAMGTMIGFVGLGLAPSLGAALAMTGVGTFFMGTSFSVGAATLSEVTPRAAMGRVSAIYSLVQQIFGAALGPLLVALASQQLFSGRFALAYAMALCCGVFGAATIAAILLLRRRLIAADRAYV